MPGCLTEGSVSGPRRLSTNRKSSLSQPEAPPILPRDLPGMVSLLHPLFRTVSSRSPLPLSRSGSCDYPFPDLAGISFEGLAFSLYRDGKKIRDVRGDLLFTHTGLSGPGILHLSRYIMPDDTLTISFLPGMRQEMLKKDLVSRMAASGTKQVKSILAGYSLPARFITRLLEMIGIPPELTGAHLPKKERDELVRLLSAFPLRILGPGGWDEAMVTRGGVSLEEVNPDTMESLLVPHLYLIGEVLDIDGDTGGYNLQAAFSTAMAAAIRPLLTVTFSPVPYREPGCGRYTSWHRDTQPWCRGYCRALCRTIPPSPRSLLLSRG